MVVLHSNPWDSVLAYDMSLGGSFCSWIYQLGRLGCIYRCYGVWGVEWLVVMEPYVRLFVVDGVDCLVGGGGSGGGGSGGGSGGGGRLLGRWGWLWRVPGVVDDGGDDGGDDGDSDRVVLSDSWSDLYGFTEMFMESLYSVYWSPLDGQYRIILDPVFERVMFGVMTFVVGLVMWEGGIL